MPSIKLRSIISPYRAKAPLLSVMRPTLMGASHLRPTWAGVSVGLGGGEVSVGSTWGGLAADGVGVGVAVPQAVSSLGGI